MIEALHENQHPSGAGSIPVNPFIFIRERALTSSRVLFDIEYIYFSLFSFWWPRSIFPADGVFLGPRSRAKAQRWWAVSLGKCAADGREVRVILEGYPLPSLPFYN